MLLPPLLLLAFLGSGLADIVGPGPFLEAFAFLIVWVHNVGPGSIGDIRLSDRPCAVIGRLAVAGEGGRKSRRGGGSRRRVSADEGTGA